MLTINQILKKRRTIKIVYLNRKGNNKGTRIGEICRLATPFGKTWYYTTRRPNHFYICGVGYAVDSNILRSLVTTELDYHRNITRDPNLKIRVLLLYEGTRWRKLLIGEVADFFKSEQMEHLKSTPEFLETYGPQHYLSEFNFKLWKEEKVGTPITKQI